MAGGRAGVLAALVICLALFAQGAQCRAVTGLRMRPGARGLKQLVDHGGQVLTAMNIYVLWYGEFSPSEQSIARDFVRSIQQSGTAGKPSVESWWKLTAGYKDGRGEALPAMVQLAGEAVDTGSLGKDLKDADLARIVQRALDANLVPHQDANAVCLLLTAKDVLVESFCRNSCGTHSVLPGANKLPYAWVGNPATQCPGMCAWPFAAPAFPGAPATVPAKSPNADVGMDGMVISIAAMLAGLTTNPFGNAFYQGDAGAPLEAATACSGIYGANAYPGSPGDLLTDPLTGGNFNVYGLTKNYLVPFLWDIATSACQLQV